LLVADGLRAQDRENLAPLLDQRHAEGLPVLPRVILDLLIHRHPILPDFNLNILLELCF